MPGRLPTLPSRRVLCCDTSPFRFPPFYRAKAWRILYATRDYAGRPVVSSGMVVLSSYASSDPAARDIVAYAHPTTGIARRCAPTLRQRPVEAILGLNELVSRGYVVAATDYPGLGTPGPVGYLVGLGQGRAVIDSARAARQIPAVGGGTRIALWGFSQGAHAVLFAAAIASTYSPELSLVGVAAVARDAVDDPRLGPAYPVRVAIPATRIPAGAQEAALAPGMRASVDIVTGRRSLGAVLLSPFARLADEALRER